MVDLNIDILRGKEKLRIKLNEDGNRVVYDIVRRKFVSFKPEEFVRQLLLHYFNTEKAIPRSRMAVERELRIHKMDKRFDLLVFDNEGKAWMVVECKAPGIEVDQKVVNQAGIYNQKLKAPYLMLSNGHSNYLYRIEFESGEFYEMKTFPEI